MYSIEEAKCTPASAVEPIKSFETKKHPVRIEGHRGAGHMEHENSLKAFLKAIELGMDGIEFDVWLTKDNIPVVVHGLEGGVVEFEGGLEYKVGEIDFEVLKTYTLKNGEKIPTLAEVLDTCKDKINMNIELKESKEEVVDIVLTMLQERDMFNQITFSSFNHPMRQKIAEGVKRKCIRDKVTFGFLMEIEEIQFLDPNIAQPGDSLNLDIRFLQQYRGECLSEIRKAREKDVNIKFWFPMNFSDEDLFYDELMDLKVDTIITNKPLSILDYFAKSQRVLV